MEPRASSSNGSYSPSSTIKTYTWCHSKSNANLDSHTIALLYHYFICYSLKSIHLLYWRLMCKALPHSYIFFPIDLAASERVDVGTMLA